LSVLCAFFFVPLKRQKQLHHLRHIIGEPAAPPGTPHAQALGAWDAAL
jgi:hypothetical protein